VTLSGTREIWPPESAWIRGGRATVIIDDPIETAELTRADVTALRDRVRGIIAEHLEATQNAGND
jgi:hypothetical protein